MSQVKKQDKNITDSVLARVLETQEAKAIDLPKDYSVENALKSAWFALQDVKDRNKKPALEVCERDSIANSLFEMVVTGLNPMKKQCYFIVYGNQLTLQRSYQGNIALAKRYSNIKSAVAQVVYEGDKFEYGLDSSTGKLHIIEHKPDINNIDVTKIKGAYCTIVESDGSVNVEVMSLPQIKQAWKKSRAGQTSVHTEFGEEMSKRTVINRAMKQYINTSDDSEILENKTVPEPAEEKKTISMKIDEVEDIKPIEETTPIEETPQQPKDNQNQIQF